MLPPAGNFCVRKSSYFHMTDEFREELHAARLARNPIRFEHIYIDENVRFGKACIGKSRFTVGDLIGYLSTGMSFEEIIYNFSELTEEMINEALLFAQAKENFDNVYLVNSKEQPKAYY